MLVRKVVLQIRRRHARGQRSSSRIQRAVRFLPAGAPVTIDPDGRRSCRTRFLFRFPNVRWFVCVLGVAWARRASTGRGDESGIVRRPRRGLYSPSLDISRETTPSSARQTIRLLVASIPPGPFVLLVPRETSGHFHLSASRTCHKNDRLATPGPASCAKGFSLEARKDN